MKYYTETISADLAQKLKEKGMPYIEIDCETYDSGTEYQKDERWCNNTYAEVFDWLMEKEIYIRIIPCREVKEENGTLWAWSWFINKLTQPSINSNNFWMNWHEAADAAIEKALTLI